MMKNDRKNSGGWRLIPLLALPFVDIALILMLVYSFRTGTQETGLFLLVYLHFVPQEIAIRVYFGRKDRGWRYWAAWICRWAGVVLLALAGLLLLEDGEWQTLLIPYLYRSRHWAAMASIPLRCIFVVGGMAVILSRYATRKPAIIATLIIYPVLFMGLGIASPALKSNKVLSDLAASAFLLLIPHLYGLAGALVDPLFGKKLRLEDKKRVRKKRSYTQGPPAPSAPSSVVSSAAVPAASPAPAVRTAPAVPSPASVTTGPNPIRPRPGAVVTRGIKKPPVPPDPRETEKQLASMKSAYEARMRRQAAAKKEETESVSPATMLRKTAARLFSEGQSAASLGGQRQLVYWMAQAVPRLNGLIRQPRGKEFFAPSLQDDPDVFLPLLDDLLTEAARLLESGEGSLDEKEWESMEPESLCAGWYALTRYAAVSREGKAFTRKAAQLEKHFMKNRSCGAWLKDRYEETEGGSGS